MLRQPESDALLSLAGCHSAGLDFFADAFLSLTPAPPPFSSMNSTPPFSRARQIFRPVSGRPPNPPLADLRRAIVARAHGVDAAVDHGENLVDAGERAWPMRHHDHNTAARAHAQDRLRQRLIAFGIEIGIRLVQHDQERIAIERQDVNFGLKGGQGLGASSVRAGS